LILKTQKTEKVEGNSKPGLRELMMLGTAEDQAEKRKKSTHKDVFSQTGWYDGATAKASEYFGPDFRLKQ